MNLSKKEIMTWSNLLSLFRLLLSIPVFFLLYYIDESYAYRLVILAILLLASATDFLDGFLARKLNEITEFGKIIDPLADKIMVGVIVLQLYLLGHLPGFYFFIAAGRDLIILIGGLFVAGKINKVLPSNMLGKITVLTIGLFILCVVLELNKYAVFIYYFFFYISTILIFASLIGYIIRAKESLDWYKNESVQKY